MQDNSILNKNTKGAKKVQGQSEAAIIDQKVWYHAKAKKFRV